jgi:DNA polymerase III epsilon subunit-like protein
MSDVVFLDTETTGLDPDRHEIWDLAYIIDGSERQWFLHPDLSAADPFALKIGRYFSRHPDWLQENKPIQSAGYVARTLVKDLRDRHIVGAVPSFDDAFLKRFVAAHRLPVTWHYHLIDVEALALGYMAARNRVMALPWNSEDLSRAVGVEPNDFERHSALGDARWAKAIYERVVGQQKMEAV